MRQLYTLVYNWYQQDDLKSLTRLAESNRMWGRHDDNISSYIEAIRQMPTPEYARSEEMFVIARQIRSGVLEFTCGEQVNGEYNLYELAEILINLYQQLEEEQAQEQLRALIKDTAIPAATEYFQRAALYYDKEFEEEARNLGSRAALVDTNWEIQQLDTTAGMKYREVPELHFQKIEDPENIYVLALKDVLCIDSIHIKS